METVLGILVILLLNQEPSLAYNTETLEFKEISSGQNVSSYFGYSLQLVKDTGNLTDLIIGAPLSNEAIASNGKYSANSKVYNCGIQELNKTSCEQQIQTLGNLGSGVQFDFENPNAKVICAPSKLLDCGFAKMLPGFCSVTSNDGGKSETNLTTGNNQVCSMPTILNMDIMFVLDGSGSIHNADFDTVKQWVSDIAGSFSGTNGTIRFGVIQYSDYFSHKPITDQDFIKTEIELAEYSVDDFESKVSRIIKHGYNTYTGKAMRKTLLDFKAAKPSLPNQKKIMVLLTDGKSDDPKDVEKYSQELQDDRVTSIAVGVGEAVETELVTIANGDSNDAKNVYSVNTYAELSMIENSIKRSIEISVLEGSGANSGTANTKLENGQFGFSIHRSASVFI